MRMRSSSWFFLGMTTLVGAGALGACDEATGGEFFVNFGGAGGRVTPSGVAGRSGSPAFAGAAGSINGAAGDIGNAGNAGAGGEIGNAGNAGTGGTLNVGGAGGGSTIGSVFDAYALAAGNKLRKFSTNTPTVSLEIPVTLAAVGETLNLVAIDFRPADGRLYGLSVSATTNDIYTIDPATGLATFYTFTTSADRFTGAALGGMDFNPVPNALRLTGANAQNLRYVFTTTGLTAITVNKDTALAYVVSDVNAGKTPGVTASAYTNAVAGATTTTLYNIDSLNDALVKQGNANPNDGQLTTIGALSVDFTDTCGFDIATTGTGNTTTQHAYAVSGSILYSINLATGAATSLGTVLGGPFTGLALKPLLNLLA